MADERNWTSFNAGKMFYHIDPDIDLVTVGPNTPQAKAVLAQEK